MQAFANYAPFVTLCWEELGIDAATSYYSKEHR